jgi:general L-amino acid transport system permease protein
MTAPTARPAAPPDAPPASPPASPLGRRAVAGRWLRRNLFRGPLDGLVSVVGGVLAVYVVFRLVRFVLVTGRWEVVRVNLKLLMVGRYPDGDLDRIAVALAVAALVGGLVAGVVHRRQHDAAVAAGEPVDDRAGRRALDLVGRFWPLALGVLLVLSLTETVGPWLAAGVAAVGAVAGRVVGARLPRRAHLAVGVLAVVTPIAAVWYVADAEGWDGWGGVLLNVFVAATAIVLCFPIGVLAALGRRSRMPVVSAVSTAYIEIFRGAPLFVLLLMAGVALQFFVPRDAAPGRVVRAIVVFTLFTAAYMAEIVRGGLQSVPNGQVEAARALGLSPVRATFLVVLPQALRNVIPAQVGQFISLFKDTTLAGAAMGLFELLEVSTAIAQQGEFRGQRLLPETLAFVALVFWVGSYTMSRESQRLERKLGVGQR